MKTVRCDRTAAWAALAEHYQAHGRDLSIADAFVRDPARFESFSVEAPEVFADLSKNLVDVATRRYLLELAQQCGVPARRDAMFAGEPINTTEGRAVLHTALRAPRGNGLFSHEVHTVLDAMLAYAEGVRYTARSGIRDVVNIGIGGSDLGAQMVVPALDEFAHPSLNFHFVSNVDGHDINHALKKLKPAETLFVIVFVSCKASTSIGCALPFSNSSPMPCNTPPAVKLFVSFHGAMRPGCGPVMLPTSEPKL